MSYHRAMVLGQIGSLSRDASAVWSSKGMVALLVLVGVSALATLVVARIGTHAEGSPLMWFVGFVSLAVIVVVTLFRDGLPDAWNLGGISDWSAAGLRLLSRDPFGSSQFLLNVALFVPAGASWTWLLRRPFFVAAGLGGMSVLVELLQAVTGTGAADVADIVANAVGAGLGVSVAASLDFGPAANSRRSELGRRRTTGAIAGIVVLALVTVGSIGASRYQQSVENSLRAEFAGTNRSSIEARLAADPNSIFGAVSDLANGSFTSETSLQIRYPADFFGLRRCVYVIWNWTGVDFQKATGEACTRLIG